MESKSLTFNNDGIWTVPSGVYSVNIQAIGGGGGGFTGGSIGGGGGLARASFNVFPINKLYIYIGGPGLGFNEGKNNYDNGAGNGRISSTGGGGGALTCVTINNNNMLIVAGGGCGGGCGDICSVGGYGCGSDTVDGSGTGYEGKTNCIGGGGSSFVNNLLVNYNIPIQFQYISSIFCPGAGGINGNSGQVIISWLQPTPTPLPICNNNPCPPPIYSKPSTSFGGNTNMPTYLNTKAFRYSQLVSLPFRARGSGTVVFISNTDIPNICTAKPPRNKF